MTKEYKIIYYYADNGKAIYLDDESDEVHDMDILEINKPLNKLHPFRLLLNYDKTIDDLIRFKREFSILCQELRNTSIKTKSKKYFSINYKKYHNHSDAVYYNWKSYIDTKILKDMDLIVKHEFNIFENNYNGALITLNLDYKNIITECYSYDYSSYYPTLLSQMQIPIREGKLIVLKRIDWKNLAFGIYRIKITKFNKRFTNIFNFCSDNHYTSSMLKCIYEYKDFFELEFELLPPDDEYNYNALIYEYKDLIRGRDLFGNWLKDMLIVKQKLLKNSLVKHLLSTLAGTLYSYKKLYVDDIDGMDISFVGNLDDTKYKILKMSDHGQYKIVETNNAYKYKLARIKPFLIGLGRIHMLKLIMKNNLIDNVVAIHTDRVTLNKPFDFSKEKYYPTFEEKSSGTIRFDNAVRYYHICKKCNSDYKFQYGCKKCKL